MVCLRQKMRPVPQSSPLALIVAGVLGLVLRPFHLEKESPRP